MSDEEFNESLPEKYKSLFEKLKEICRLAIEQKLETDELIRLLTPLLDLLTENFSFLPSFRKRILHILTESFSSVPLSFSLQKMDIGYRNGEFRSGAPAVDSVGGGRIFCQTLA